MEIAKVKLADGRLLVCPRGLRDLDLAWPFPPEGEGRLYGTPTLEETLIPLETLVGKVDVYEYGSPEEYLWEVDVLDLEPLPPRTFSGYPVLSLFRDEEFEETLLSTLDGEIVIRERSTDQTPRITHFLSFVDWIYSLHAGQVAEPRLKTTGEYREIVLTKYRSFGEMMLESLGLRPTN